MTHPPTPPHRPARPPADPGPAPARLGRAGSPHLDLDAFNAYLDRGLDDADRRTAAAHLAACPDCRRELAELRATVALLRGLPHYAPRRSFRLGPEHAATRPGGRLAPWAPRLLPALPALRAAAAAVALLLVAAVAGDLVSTSRDDAPAQRSEVLAAPTAAPPALQQAPAPQTEGVDEEAAGAGETESSGAASNRVEAPGAAAEAPGLPRGAPAEPPAAPARQAADAADPPAAPGIASAPEPADDQGTTARADPPSAGSDRPSGWRLAQVSLGLLLLWLLVSIVGLQRLSRRT